MNRTRKNVLFLRASGPILKTARTHRFASMYQTVGFVTTAIGWNRTSKSTESVSLQEFELGRAFDVNLEANYGSGLRSLPKFFKWFCKGLEQAKSESKIDFVHACDLEVAFLASLHPATRRLPLVYDICDFRHVTFNAGFARWVATKIQKYVEKRASLIILPTESRLQGLEVEQSAAKVVVIQTGPAFDNIPNVDEQRPKSEAEKFIFFGGTLGTDRGLLIACNAIKGSGWKLKIAGFGALETMLSEIANSNENVEFLGSLLPSDLLKWTASSDAILMTYDPSIETNRMCAPNKIAEALLLGKRVIYSEGMEIGSEARMLDSMFLPVTFGDEEQLRELLKMMPREAPQETLEKARTLFHSKYSLEANAKLLESSLAKSGLL